MVIYKITNIVTQDFYIGKTTKTAQERFNRHLYLSGYGSNCHIHASIRKYGKENFSLSIIEDGIDCEDQLNEREIYHISINQPRYNSTTGGEGTRGLKRSEETRKRMSDSAKGRKISTEQRQKISATLKGRKLKPETVEKMKLLTGDKNPFFGKKHTEETKKKISESKKGQLKGRVFSEEHRRKLSESAKKRHSNP